MCTHTIDQTETPPGRVPYDVARHTLVFGTRGFFDLTSHLVLVERHLLQTSEGEFGGMSSLEEQSDDA